VPERTKLASDSELLTYHIVASDSAAAGLTVGGLGEVEVRGHAGQSRGGAPITWSEECSIRSALTASRPESRAN